MAATLWVLWLVRNEVVWGNGIWTMYNICMQIQCLRTSWKELFAKSNLPTPLASPAIWLPPQFGFVKCNVDAMIFDDGAGYGAVLRDHEGRFVAAKSGRLSTVSDPFMAEALAVKEALTWIKDVGHVNVIIETDCLTFVLLLIPVL